MNKYYKENYFKDNESVSIFKKKDIPCATETEHMHDFIEIVYILSGSGTQTINANTYKVESGSLLFINYGQTHSFTADNMMYYNIMIKPEAVSEKIISTDNAFEILSLTAFEDFKDADTSCPFVKFKGEMRPAVENLIYEMHREYQKGYTGTQTVLRGYLTVLLAYIFRAMLPAVPSLNTIPAEITGYIEKNFNQKLSLEHLAQKCFYSPKYFSRVFKECYGITVSDYIKKTRLEEALRLLDKTQYTVEEISSMVGYDDTARFYKYFKEVYGVTPREYKKGL